MFPTKEEAICRAENLAAPDHTVSIPDDKPELPQEEETKPMADEPKQSHAQAIQDVVGTFQEELGKLSRRSAEIRANTSRAFLKAHTAFDHADYINEMVEEAVDDLTKFLGPPPNILAIPKAEREIEDAVVIDLK
jgi:uncharacterized protein involved in type VI secretion and phage assembly